jgi:hypothetical protein
MKANDPLGVLEDVDAWVQSELDHREQQKALATQFDGKQSEKASNSRKSQMARVRAAVNARRQRGAATQGISSDTIILAMIQLVDKAGPIKHRFRGRDPRSCKQERRWPGHCRRESQRRRPNQSGLD